MSDFQSQNWVRPDDGLADCQSAGLFLALTGAALSRIDGVLEGMVAAGHGADAISQYLGCARTQIITELESRKIQINVAQLNKAVRLRKGGWSPHENMLLVAGWLNGVSASVIAELVDRKPGAVYGKKRRIGLPARPRTKTTKPAKTKEYSQSASNALILLSDDIAVSGELSASVSPSSDEEGCETDTKAACATKKALEPDIPIVVEARTPRVTLFPSFASGIIISDDEMPDSHDVKGWCERFKKKSLKSFDLSGMTKPDAMIETAVRTLGGLAGSDRQGNGRQLALHTKPPIAASPHAAPVTRLFRV